MSANKPHWGRAGGILLLFLAMLLAVSFPGSSSLASVEVSSSASSSETSLPASTSDANTLAANSSGELLPNATPSAVGSLFTAKINEWSPCIFMVTGDDPDNPTVQVGNGANVAIDPEAIPESTTLTLSIPRSVVDPATGISYAITALGAHCFEYCQNIHHVTFASDSAVATIDNSAFTNCYFLTSNGLDANSSVVVLGDSCFAGCGYLFSTGLAANKTITTLGAGCFDDCARLLSTGLASNSTAVSLGANCFEGCASLVSTGLESNSSIRFLPYACFSGCSSLASTGLASNSSVTSLGPYCFMACTSLTSTGLECNSSISSLGDCCFYKCTSLVSTGLERNLSVSSLGSECFRKCAALRGDESGSDLVLPARLSLIGGQAFAETSFTRVYLPDPVLPSVGDQAFSFLSGQGTLYVLPELASVGSISLGGANYSIQNGSLVSMVPPVLSEGSSSRTGDDSAVVSFDSDVAGAANVSAGTASVSIDIMPGLISVPLRAGVGAAATSASVSVSRSFGPTATSYNTYSSRISIPIEAAYAAPSYASSALASGCTGLQSSWALGTAAGGSGSFSYALAPGSALPPGLALAADGTLSGSPSAAGSYSFRVAASDAATGLSALADWALSISSPAPAPTPDPGSSSASDAGSGSGAISTSASSGSSVPGSDLATGLLAILPDLGDAWSLPQWALVVVLCIAEAACLYRRARRRR